MGIDVRVERGDGALVRVAWPDGEMRLARLVRRAWDPSPDEFPFLTSIDPYGDTAFNYLMAERLCAELPRLAPRFPGESDILIVLAAACDEVANAAGHELRLVFLGD